MRRLIAVLLVGLVAWPLPAVAAGWTDFSFKIAPGFVIDRANSEDVVLRGAKYEASSARNVGPVVAYSVSESLILVRHREKVGNREPFFYRVRRRDGSTLGPLTEAELLGREEVRPLLPVDWTPVEHPRPLVPLLIGTLMVGSVLGPWVLVPLRWLGLLLWFWRRRTRGKPARADLLLAWMLSACVAVWSTLAVAIDAPFPLWLPGVPATLLGLHMEGRRPLEIIAFFTAVAVAWIPYGLLAVCLLRFARGLGGGGTSGPSSLRTRKNAPAPPAR